MYMTEFADVYRVIELLGCSQAMAYKVIRTLNEELKEKGFLTIQGVSLIKEDKTSRR